MTQDILNSLAILSTENDFVKQEGVESAMKRFADLKGQKKKCFRLDNEGFSLACIKFYIVINSLFYIFSFSPCENYTCKGAEVQLARVPVNLGPSLLVCVCACMTNIAKIKYSPTPLKLETKA